MEVNGKPVAESLSRTRSLARTYVLTDGRTDRKHNAPKAHKIGDEGTQISLNFCTKVVN